MMDKLDIDEALQSFLKHTQEKLDKYFDQLGYVCFIFNKQHNKGESLYLTNSPTHVDAVLSPYANMNNVVETKIRKKKLKKLRRVK